ncbi:MAG: hypothetical protein JNL60_19655 [Bacteroidia bacterium]|nr:hypothetical protein [Bacteroidia bacterium]
MLDDDLDDVPNVKETQSPSGVTEDFREYLKSDYKLLFKALWFYSFPLLLICYLSAPFFFNASPRVENIFYLKNHVSKHVYLLVVLNSLLLVLSLLMLTWVVNRTVLLRNEHKSEPGRILYSVFKKSFGAGLNTYILNFLILYLVYTAINYLNSYLGKMIALEDTQTLSVYARNETNWISAYLLPLIFFPPLFYFGFSALYVSVRDEIGISDALKKIYELTSGKMGTIYLQSVVILLIAFFVQLLTNEIFYFGFSFIPNMNIIFFIVVAIKELLSFCILALLQVAAILLFRNVEAGPQVDSEPLEN